MGRRVERAVYTVDLLRRLLVDVGEHDYVSRVHQSAWLRAGACRRRGARRAWLRLGWRPPALARRWRGRLEGARCGETPARGGTCKGALFFLYSFPILRGLCDATSTLTLSRH